jgi:hypothetical protein
MASRSKIIGRAPSVAADFHLPRGKWTGNRTVMSRFWRASVTRTIHRRKSRTWSAKPEKNLNAVGEEHCPGMRSANIGQIAADRIVKILIGGAEMKIKTRHDRLPQ